MVPTNDDKCDLDRGIDGCRDADRVGVESNPKALGPMYAEILNVDTGNCVSGQKLLTIGVDNLSCYPGALLFVPTKYAAGFVAWVKAFGTNNARLADRLPLERPSKTHISRAVIKLQPWVPVCVVQSDGVMQSEGSNVHITLASSEYITLCKMQIGEFRELSNLEYKSAILMSQTCLKCFMVLQWALATEFATPVGREIRSHG